MESIVSIVALIAIYSLIAIVKVVFSKDGGVEAKPDIGEAFPSIEPLDPIEEPSPVKNTSKKSTVRTFCTAPDNRRIFLNPGTEEPKPASNENQKADKIMMKSKSDAKRAFIYSEVFNRKY